MAGRPAGRLVATYAALPARTAIEPELFVRSVDAWLGGGAFPALGLVALTDTPEGGLISEGLTFFAGQEIVENYKVVLVRTGKIRTCFAVGFQIRRGFHFPDVSREGADTRRETDVVAVFSGGRVRMLSRRAS